MPLDQVALLRDALSRYEGVPTWWADLFVNLGLSVEEAVAWVRTAETDSSSVLRRARDKEMNITLQGYARSRGITLLGAGDGDTEVQPRGDRLTHRVSTVVTPQEQEAVIAEVGAYADVEFREKVNGVYTQHAVANAVRSVHWAYLSKIAGGAMVLEAGASVRNAVLSGVDFRTRHCCCPVLDVRDSVRHSLRGWLTFVARPESKYTERVRLAAAAALDPSSGFVCQQRAQDCTRQVEMICSNESTHDVPFDDLPLIMARHGAKLWTGFMTRAPGVRSVGGPSSGSSSVLGTRWRVDRAKDQIVFHFGNGSSFSYTHKFSQWVKYEERFGYRWRGQYFDYVYTRLPVTTVSSLAFVIARVPKSTGLLREPVYKDSGAAGMVTITSVRAVGGCLNVKHPKFEPCEFQLDAVVFDRAFETRLAQGERGNLGSTMAYLRSARVKLAVNGVDLGAVGSVPVDLLEPSAVAIEVLASDSRRSGERDYAQIVRVASSESALTGLISYFAGSAQVVGSVLGVVQRAVRAALVGVVNGRDPLIVKVERCQPFVKVTDGAEEGHVSVKPQLQTVGCGCAELAAVKAALKIRGALGRVDRKRLEEYAAQLERVAEVCVAHDVHRVAPEEAEDQFFDASEQTPVDEASDISSTVSTERTSTFDSSGSDVTSATSVCDSLCVDGFVTSTAEVNEGSAVSAMKEYARWAQMSDKNARTEAAVDCSVMFQLGTPTLLDIERSTTARTRHAVVVLKGGGIGKIHGTLRDDEKFSEVYVRSLSRTCKVYTESSGKRYIRENVTELGYTNSGLIVVNGDQLARGVMQVLHELPRGFTLPKYPFVMGVPGAGKTYQAMKLILQALDDGKSVIYLTATTAGKDEAVSFMTAKRGKDLVVCATYDSYVINGAIPVGGGSVDLLVMDEAPKAHKGELLACIVKASPKAVKLYGDSHQIPWLPFIANFDAKYAEVGDEFEYEHLYVSHRLGAKACAMWLDVYGKIFPCDCHEHEDIDPSVVRVTSASGVLTCADGKTLSFTQEEKSVMKREGGFTASLAELKSRDRGGLSTVAEDQGGTHADVHVVRLVNKKNPKESSRSPSIWNRQPWVLVATTRHTRKLTYFTVSEDDLVCARIDLASCPIRLDAVRRQLDWGAVQYKAKQVRRFGIV